MGSSAWSLRPKSHNQSINQSISHISSAPLHGKKKQQSVRVGQNHPAIQLLMVQLL